MLTSTVVHTKCTLATIYTTLSFRPFLQKSVVWWEFFDLLWDKLIEWWQKYLFSWRYNLNTRQKLMSSDIDAYSSPVNCDFAVLKSYDWKLTKILVGNTMLLYKHAKPSQNFPSVSCSIHIFIFTIHQSFLPFIYQRPRTQRTLCPRYLYNRLSPQWEFIFSKQKL